MHHENSLQSFTSGALDLLLRANAWTVMLKAADGGEISLFHGFKPILN